ncbi:MAG: CHAD domain-containing protein [Verrucomicrobiaceae bacterium]|jgi:hypothetical protein|nr:MAG: CHAD domain-containing protein [Verrucomicrobiaceae bacterium]
MIIPDETTAQHARERLTTDCETMKSLLLGLLDSKGKVAEEIHAIRKLGKSLRGGFSLFRLGKSAALEIQAIGRLLSGPRDAVSRLNTWNKLGWVGDPGISAAIAGLLDQQTHSAARRPPPETIAWCVDRVSAALDELHALPAEHLPERIGKGMAKLEKRVRSRCRRLDHRAAEDFHEARKAVKAWLGAVGFLPEEMIKEDPLLHDLADLLGDENDLATLSAWLDEHGFTRHFAAELWTAIESTRQRLQRKAIKDAARLGTASEA